MAAGIPSIAYEPRGEPSLFDLWEAGADAPLPAPLAVRDPVYRARIVEILTPFQDDGRRLVSVGAGNGVVEAMLVRDKWEVLATDPAFRALEICREKGLSTARFELLVDPPPGRFDVIYCDGVMGHLWDPRSASVSAWKALAGLGRRGSLCLLSNDLSDDDQSPRFAVRGSPTATFYRPPPGWYGRDATATGLWRIEAEQHYRYRRRGTTRRREVVLARLLTDERVEPEDRV